MAAANQTQPPTWGTWEDLLLACAVKRHGLHNWDSVSTELRTKTSLLTTTAQICHQKYQDLKRRFATTNEIPCLEDLTTRVRVAELKRDLQRYDVSILALQLKVKKLEEERERSSTQQQQDAAEDKPDLADFKHDGSQNDKSPAQIPEENRSVNGSNSTDSERRETEKADPDPVGSEDGEASEEELGGELSSDMQSSASLERKRMRRRRRVDLEGYGGDDDGMMMKGKSEASDGGLLEKIRAHTESGLFARRLQEECKEYKEVIRQHVDLETIQQARMMNQGLGASSLAFYRDLLLLLTNYIVFFPKLSHESRTAHHLRDLVLDHIDNHTTTTNKSDSHSSPKPDHIETPPHSSNNTHHHQHLTTTTTTTPPPPPPIVVCRKRSSVSTKPSSDPDVQPHTQSDDNDNDIISNPPPAAAAVDVEASLLEKPITGTRSSRRSNSASNTRKPPVAANTSNDTTPNPKQNVNKTEEKQGITPPTTTTNKKTPQVPTSDKKKSVADFLKRIKKNSPEVTKKITKGAEQKKNNAASNNNDVKERGKEKAAKRGVERKQQQQQQGKEETSPSKRSVGRPPKRDRDTDHGGKEKEANPPKKRARR